MNVNEAKEHMRKLFDIIRSSKGKFFNYLDEASKNLKFGFANTLLIHSQNPKVEVLETREYLEKKGYEVEESKTLFVINERNTVDKVYPRETEELEKHTINEENIPEIKAKLIDKLNSVTYSENKENDRFCKNFIMLMVLKNLGHEPKNKAYEQGMFLLFTKMQKTLQKKFLNKLFEDSYTIITEIEREYINERDGRLATRQMGTGISKIPESELSISSNGDGNGVRQGFQPGLRDGGEDVRFHGRTAKEMETREHGIGGMGLDNSQKSRQKNEKR